jgi:hypothetical protein
MLKAMPKLPGTKWTHTFSVLYPLPISRMVVVVDEEENAKRIQKERVISREEDEEEEEKRDINGGMTKYSWLEALKKAATELVVVALVMATDGPGDLELAETGMRWALRGPRSVVRSQPSNG